VGGVVLSGGKRSRVGNDGQRKCGGRTRIRRRLRCAVMTDLFSTAMRTLKMSGSPPLPGSPTNRSTLRLRSPGDETFFQILTTPFSKSSRNGSQNARKSATIPLLTMSECVSSR